MRTTHLLRVNPLKRVRFYYDNVYLQKRSERKGLLSAWRKALSWTHTSSPPRSSTSTWPYWWLNSSFFAWHPWVKGPPFGLPVVCSGAACDRRSRAGPAGTFGYVGPLWVTLGHFWTRWAAWDALGRVGGARGRDGPGPCGALALLVTICHSWSLAVRNAISAPKGASSAAGGASG
eukprot:1194737-Prorocentrum_minimum.AAC.1